MQEHDCGNNPLSRLKASFRVGSSISAFSERDIPDACLEHLLEGAGQACPRGDLQPCRWIVVKSKVAKQQLEAALRLRVPIRSAPAILICLADTSAWKSAPQYLQEMVAREKLTEEQSREALRRLRDYYSVSPEAAKRTALANTFVALHHMISAAADCGLSACWVTEFDEASIKTHFHIPDQFLVAALLPLGYCEEVALAPAAKPPSQPLVYKEKYGEALTFSASP